jgi:predicted permease
MNHLRYAFRQFAKSPGFTATALATLAICFAANLAIYAVVDAVLVRSLPFPEANRLVTIYNSYPGAGVERAAASIPNYFDRRNSIKAFTSVSIVNDGNITVGGKGSPHRVDLARVSPEFFATLGVPLAMGHAFKDDQLTYGTDEVAVLTDGFWRSEFAADPNVLGRTFLNDGIAITVVGVLPPGFHYLSSHAQFFRPAAHFLSDREARNRHNNNWQMVARLAPGATLAEAQAQLNAFNAQQIIDDPVANLIKGAGYHTLIKSLHEDHVQSIKPVLLLLQCGALFLLLIGGVNLANLLLIRASGRTKELAVRQALGASHLHLVREALVETILLCVTGGMLGLLLGAFAIQLLSQLGSDKLPLGAMIGLDNRITALSILASVVVGVGLAVPIIWFNFNARLAAGLQSESRSGTTGRAAQRLRHGFIVAQVALAFVLLSGAGLLGVSLKRVLAASPGFKTGNVLTGRLSLPWLSYKDDASRIAFVEKLLPAVRALPGVASVAIDNGLPFSESVSNSAVFVENNKPRAGDSVRAHFLSNVTGDYWTTMGIPLLQGRFLEDADNTRKPRVCVVDEAFAKRYWPGNDALGRRLSAFDSEGVFKEENAFTIVGVVANVKQNELVEDAGHGAVYFPYAVNAANSFLLVVKTSLPPESMTASIQKTIFQLDPQLPLDDARTLQSRIDDSLVTRRSPAILAGTFAGVALLLAAIGTYGVLSYTVSQRRREIGVRMALGALPQQVLAQFIQLGVKLLLAGLCLGVLGSWAAARAMQSLLFGVGSWHAGIFFSTVFVMSAVVFFAIALPARRAARVNPIDALRSE